MKTILSILVGVALGAVLAFGGLWLWIPGAAMVETVSPHDFATTQQRLRDAAAAAGWKIPMEHDLQATMQKNGHEVRPVVVFEMCQPDHASRVLAQSDERVASAMMPCRVSVYVKEDGKTYLARLNSPLLARPMGGLVREVMDLAFVENEAIIAKAIAP